MAEDPEAISEVMTEIALAVGDITVALVVALENNGVLKRRQVSALIKEIERQLPDNIRRAVLTGASRRLAAHRLPLKPKK